MRSIRPIGFSLVLLSALIPGAKADFISTTLGSAGPSDYGLLATGTNVKVGINVPNLIGIVGNVGIATGGDLAANNTNATSPGNEVNGNVYFQGTSNFAGSGGCSPTPSCLVTGSIFTNQSQIATAISDANNAAAIFAALTATSGVTSVTGTQTINRTGAVTVVDLTDLNLGNGTVLTLNGNAGDEFVINVDASDWHTLQGKILESGGLSEADVVINVTGTGTLGFSGGGNAAGIDGILLASSANIAMSPGFINGELIAGGSSIQIVSGAEVHEAAAVPEPQNLGFLVIAFVGLIAVGYKKLPPTIWSK